MKTLDPSPKKKDRVLGGALTRSPEGLLWTLQTSALAATPQAVQELWPELRRNFYPREWQGQPFDKKGRAIEWRQRAIRCRCGRTLGDYVAYRTYHLAVEGSEEFGLVEDATLRYTQGSSSAGERTPRSKPRFWFEGAAHLSAKETIGCFRCRSCNKVHRFNLAELGRSVFENPERGPYRLPWPDPSGKSPVNGLK